MKNVIAKRALSTAIGAFGPALILTIFYVMMTLFRTNNPEMRLQLFTFLEPILFGLIVLMLLSAIFASVPTFFKPKVLVESAQNAVHIHGAFQKTDVVHCDDIDDIDYRYFTRAGRGQSNLSRHGTLVIVTPSKKYVIRNVEYVDKAYERLQDFIKA